MADREHLSQSVLRGVASFFRQMEQRDQNAFLFIWDQWVRVLAHMREHMYETRDSAALSNISALQKHLNLPFLFDIEDAVYVRGVATGQLARDEFPLPGANTLVWPASHEDELGVEVGDVLTLVFGAIDNLSDFEISDVSDTGITTVAVFNPESAALVDYRVDRGAVPDPVFVGCAEVYSIPDTIRSIPRLCSTVGPSGQTLVEGADYVIKDGHIGFYNRGPQQHENGLTFYFATEVHEDEDLPYSHFGFPIEYRKESSEEYVRGLQALWFALWSGPAVQNVEVGVSVIFGLPFTVPGVVESIARTEGGGYEVVIQGRDRVVHVLSEAFPPIVTVGQTVGFQSLTAGARVADYLNEPEFIEVFDLKPRMAKFHTFFVVIAHEVLQELQSDGTLVDFEPVVGFVERIKAARTDFYLLVEMQIPEEIPVNAETPVIDVVVRAHALLGANPANLTSIDSFGSPGYAHPHGYADHYVERLEMTATILTARDSADELVVAWDEGPDQETPEDGVMPGRFVLNLDSISLRESGTVDLGGTTITLSLSTYDQSRIHVGDVLLISNSVSETNQEAFTVTEKVIGGLTFVLTLSRSAVVELGRAFEIRRFYEVVSNEGGKLRLESSTLEQDGMDVENPGVLTVWRRLIGGRQMYGEYVDQESTGRFPFVSDTDRLPFDFDQDAVQIVDRITISTLDADDVVTEVLNESALLGPITGPSLPPTSPPPTTATPTTAGPTTATPTTAEPTTVAPTTVAPTTVVPTTLSPPAAVAGLLLNLDAQDITGKIDDDAMGTWIDSGPGGYDSTVFEGSPTYKATAANGFPCVRFDGNDAFRLPVGADTDFNLTTGYTMLIVSRVEDGVSFGKGDSSLGVGANGRRYLFSGQHEFQSGPDSGNNRFWGHGTGPQRYSIQVVRATGDGVNGASIRSHGQAQPNLTGNADWNISTGNPERPVVGRAWGGLSADHLTGDVAQILIYDNALSVPDIEDLEAYLSDRWGIPLVHPLGFNPADKLVEANNFRTWYDIEESNNAVADDATLTKLWDLSGADNHLVSGPGAPIRYAEIGGRSIIDLNGTTQYLLSFDGTRLTNPADGHVMIAVGVSPSNVNGVIISKSDASLGTIGRRTYQLNFNQDSQVQVRHGTDAGFANSATFGDDMTQPWVVGAHSKSNTEFVSRVNDNPSEVGTAEASFDLAGANTDRTSIGRSFADTSAEYSPHKIASIIILVEPVSDDDFDDLVNDLGYLYDFAWAIHPQSTFAPTTPVPTTVVTTPAPTTPAPTTAALPLPSDDFSGGTVAELDGVLLSDGVNTWAAIQGVMGKTGGLSSTSNTTGGNGNGAMYRVDSMIDKTDVNVAYDYGSGRAGVFARTDATGDNGYFLYHDASQIQLYRIDAGAITLMQQSPEAISGGDTIRLECIGTAIKAYINAVQKLSQTNANHTIGKCGLWTDVAARTLDNFVVTDA